MYAKKSIFKVQHGNGPSMKKPFAYQKWKIHEQLCSKESEEKRFDNGYENASKSIRKKILNSKKSLYQPFPSGSRLLD